MNPISINEGKVDEIAIVPEFSNNPAGVFDVSYHHIGSVCMMLESVIGSQYRAVRNMNRLV